MKLVAQNIQLNQYRDKMDFWIKIIETPKEIVVAVCDEDILGKKFEEGEIFIEVLESFYRGELMNSSECVECMKKATILNLVGMNIVGMAIELGFIDEKRVLKIGKTLHAQMAFMR